MRNSAGTFQPEDELQLFLKGVKALEDSCPIHQAYMARRAAADARRKAADDQFEAQIKAIRKREHERRMLEVRRQRLASLDHTIRPGAHRQTPNRPVRGSLTWK